MDDASAQEFVLNRIMLRKCFVCRGKGHYSNECATTKELRTHFRFMELHCEIGGLKSIKVIGRRIAFNHRVHQLMNAEAMSLRLNRTHQRQTEAQAIRTAQERQEEERRTQAAQSTATGQPLSQALPFVQTSHQSGTNGGSGQGQTRTVMSQKP